MQVYAVAIVCKHFKVGAQDLSGRYTHMCLAAADSTCVITSKAQRPAGKQTSLWCCACTQAPQWCGLHSGSLAA